MNERRDHGSGHVCVTYFRKTFLSTMIIESRKKCVTICLFKLMLNVTVKSYGHVETLPYGAFEPLRLIFMDDLT